MCAPITPISFKFGFAATSRLDNKYFEDGNCPRRPFSNELLFQFLPNYKRKHRANARQKNQKLVVLRRNFHQSRPDGT